MIDDYHHIAWGVAQRHTHPAKPGALGRRAPQVVWRCIDRATTEGEKVHSPWAEECPILWHGHRVKFCSRSKPSTLLCPYRADPLPAASDVPIMRPAEPYLSMESLQKLALDALFIGDEDVNETYDDHLSLISLEESTPVARKRARPVQADAKAPDPAPVAATWRVMWRV